MTFRHWVHEIWLQNCDELAVWHTPPHSEQVYFHQYKYWLKQLYRAHIGNELHTRENEDKLCTLEEAEAFAKKRNYTYTDFPEWKSNRDIV